MSMELKNQPMEKVLILSTNIINWGKIQLNLR